MGATDSANTDMNYDHIESTIQPEAAPPEAEPEADMALEWSSPEQPLDIPKPKKKGWLAGTKATYKRARKRITQNTPIPASMAAPMPAKRSSPPRAMRQ